MSNFAERLRWPSSSQADPQPGLDGFRSESGAATLSLADVTTRQMPIDWSEAVALVAELCSVLEHEGVRDGSIPATSSVRFTDAGALALVPGARGTGQIAGLARTLEDLLTTAHTPAPLRLFVTQAISFETYASLHAFSTALAYFERDQRAELVSAVYRRLLTTPAPVVAVQHVEPAPVQRPFPAIPRSEQAQRTVPTYAYAIALGTVVVVATFLWMGFRSGTPIDARTRPAPDATPATVTADATRANVPSGPGTNAPVVEQTSAARTGAVAPVAPAAAPARRTLPPVATASIIAVEAGAPRDAAGAQPPSAPAAPGSAARTTAPPAGAPAGARMSVLSFQPAPSSLVYSSTSDGVQPPIMLYPQLPPVVAPFGTGTDAINTMELVIGEDGTVLQARMAARPTRMTDMMLLSGAKTWRFQPATREGLPVPYRLIVNWTVTR